MPLTHKIIKDALEASDSPYELRSYSGREMFGRSCPAVTGSRLQTILGRLVYGFVADHRGHVEGEDLETLRLLIATSERDQLGENVVVYWPNVEWKEELDHGT